ncbi:MAG: hypothetical protein NDI61_07365 [Bdellovibrionaceae bacterium]|nr:hypothetical protein [Pseudobdellovibrionaceae bacterium]
MKTRIRLVSIDGRDSGLIGRQETLSPQVRVRRALKILLAHWAVAAATVLLPALHFVLPPAFLLSGLFFGLKIWRVTHVYLDSRGPCPVCGQELAIPMLVKKIGHKEICPHCRHAFRLQ